MRLWRKSPGFAVVIFRLPGPRSVFSRKQVDIQAVRRQHSRRVSDWLWPIFANPVGTGYFILAIMTVTFESMGFHVEFISFSKCYIFKYPISVWLNLFRRISSHLNPRFLISLNIYLSRPRWWITNGGAILSGPRGHCRRSDASV